MELAQRGNFTPSSCLKEEEECGGSGGTDTGIARPNGLPSTRWVPPARVALSARYWGKRYQEVEKRGTVGARVSTWQRGLLALVSLSKVTFRLSYFGQRLTLGGPLLFSCWGETLAVCLCLVSKLYNENFGLFL